MGGKDYGDYFEISQLPINFPGLGCPGLQSSRLWQLLLALCPPLRKIPEKAVRVCVVNLNSRPLQKQLGETFLYLLRVFAQVAPPSFLKSRKRRP